MLTSCNSVVNYSEIIKNNNFFLKPGLIIALNQIVLIKKSSINLSRVVNIYCDSIPKNRFNPEGILRTISNPGGEKYYFSHFQEDLIFCEIGHLNNEVHITTEPDFEITYFQLVVKPVNGQ